MAICLEGLGAKLGKFVAQKNISYGSAFEAAGPFLALLCPKGLPPERFGDALLCVRVFDKLMRVMTRKDAFGESPWLDVAGYGLLGAHQDGCDLAAVEGLDLAQSLRDILDYARASAVYSGDGRPRRSEMGTIVRMAAATLRALGAPQPDDETFLTPMRCPTTRAAASRARAGVTAGSGTLAPSPTTRNRSP